MEDSLRSIRNNFYLGFYETCMSEAKTLGKNKELSDAADVYYYRALLEQNPEEVGKSIPKKASTALQTVLQLATYRTASDDNKEMVFDTLKEWLSSDLVKSDNTLQLLASQIYFEEKDLKQALQVLHKPDESLEKLAMQVTIYLKLERIDLAQKALKQMQELDDDDTLTQLSQAVIHIHQGGDKVTEASFILQEFLEKFGPSDKLLNCLAVCQIHQRNYTQALQHLKQAREIATKGKTPLSADTFVNTIVCFQNVRKSNDLIAKVQIEFQTAYPSHPWFQKQSELDRLFDKHGSSYK